MGIKDTFKLYQDNDPKHKAYKVRSWLLYNCPKVIEPPPQPPDMKPIENLWNDLDRRIRQKPVSSTAELKKDFSKNGTKLAVITHQKLFPTCHNVCRSNPAFSLFLILRRHNFECRLNIFKF